MVSSAFLSRASARFLSTPSMRASSLLGKGSGLRPSIPASTTSFAALMRYASGKSYPPHTLINMPALSPTMTAGSIGAWQKKAGDALQPGDVLVEIETDKAQMDFEFQDEGVLAKILRDSGERDIAVGKPIAVLVEDESSVNAFEDFKVEEPSGGAEAQEAPAPSKEEPSAAKPEEPAAPAAESAEPETSADKLQPALDREVIAPAAKSLALEKGVPLKDIKGTGPGGIVTRADVERYQAPAPAAGAGAAAYTDSPLSSMRRTIAKRLIASVQGNPHYFVSATLSVSKLSKLRQALNEQSNGEYKLSINDFLVKALGTALTKVPAVNSHWIEENGDAKVRAHNTVDISVAVATPNGLITPIVRGVEGRGLASISATVKELSKRARDNKLAPEDYIGGTFTISNMGMNPAVERFTAIINPPQAGILAVGTTKKVAVPVERDDGSLEVDWDEQIVVTGSFDHKIVDGAVGGEFMRALKKVVENPLELLL